MKTLAKLEQLFNKLTTPQAIVISAGMLSLVALASSAFDAGLAPDIDWTAKRIRFVQIDDSTSSDPDEQ